MRKLAPIVYLLLIFTGVLIIDLSCGRAMKNVSNTPANDSIGNDTTEYELLVFDVNFENWLTTHAKPIDFYSHSYYKMRNRMYVMAWNANYVNSPTGPYHFYIEYDPTEDYDKELEYRLYYYFKYVEDLYNIKIR